MAELPTGTLTLLFSDIEGSTALLRRLGDRYGEALSAQRALLRACFAEYHGREMGTEGDSFFVVFQSAGAAVSCCVAAQLALSAHAWPEDVAVRVRMGLHSGEPARHEDSYMGMDVHRAARIAAASHGGQVVLSDATRLLAASRLPADVSVRDLGLHRLKDIEEPERIYQLVAVGLPERFPPLKSLGSDMRLAAALTNLGNLETSVGNLGRATEVLTEAIALDQKQGDLLGVAMDRHALAMASLRAGRALEARDLLSATFGFVASAGNADILATTLELSACVAAELGEGMRAARLAGAAEAVRLLAGMPILEFDAALLERFLAPARAAIARREWDAEYGAGRALTQQQAVALLLAQG